MDTDRKKDDCGGGGRAYLETDASTREGILGAPGKLTIVHGDHVQTVQKLPFVFVDPLHMDVKHGRWVDLHLVFLFQELGEFQLIFLWRVNGPELSSLGRHLGVIWSPKPTLQGEGRDLCLAVSPASLWLFRGGRCRHLRNCGALSAGSDLSHNPLQFSVNLKEHLISGRDNEHAHHSSSLLACGKGLSCLVVHKQLLFPIKEARHST